MKLLKSCRRKLGDGTWAGGFGCVIESGAEGCMELLGSCRRRLGDGTSDGGFGCVSGEVLGVCCALDWTRSHCFIVSILSLVPPPVGLAGGMD